MVLAAMSQLGLGTLDVNVHCCNELGYRYKELAILLQQDFSRHGERSLLCDIMMCDINVEILCRYDNVCLVRIDNYDNLMNNVHVGTLAQAYT